MYSNCYFIGSKDCNESNVSLLQKNQSAKCTISVKLIQPPVYLLQFTLKQVCTTHPNSVVNKYCYTCRKEQCEKCFTIHKNHLGDTVQCIKEKLLKYLAALQHNSEIQQKLFQKITDLKQHRELLYEQYQKEFAFTEQSYNKALQLEVASLP